ncbi:MAG: hypothetical protein AB7W16_02595 [Candidatus Obscuribacterales bacterium]
MSTILVSILLLFFSSGAIGWPFYYSSLITAFALDCSGQYEAGELVFSRTPDLVGLRGGITASSLSAKGNQLDNDSIERLNSTIARIYGRESIQSAFRFERLGDKFKYWSYHNEGKRDFESALEWYEKGLLLYKQKGKVSESLAVLSKMAYLCSQHGEQQLTVKYLEEADKIELAGISPDVRFDVLSRMSSAASTIDQTDLAEKYLAMAGREVKSESGASNVFPSGLLLVLLARLLTVGMWSGALMYRSRKYRDDLLQCSDSREALQIMNKLTTLELARGNIKEANLVSVRQLAIAESLQSVSRDPTPAIRESR